MSLWLNLLREAADDEQPDRNQRERVHDGTNLAPATSDEIESGVCDEAPEYALRDGEGERDEYDCEREEGVEAQAGRDREGSRSS